MIVLNPAIQGCTLPGLVRASSSCTGFPDKGCGDGGAAYRSARSRKDGSSGKGSTRPGRLVLVALSQAKILRQ